MSTIEIIAGESPEVTALRVQVQMLKEQMEALKAKSRPQSDRPITLKVSEKGAVSIYGLGRFPVTLYKAQALKLIDAHEEIRKFITDNERSLKDKSDETPAEAALRKQHVDDQLKSVGRAPTPTPAPGTRKIG